MGLYEYTGYDVLVYPSILKTLHCKFVLDARVDVGRSTESRSPIAVLGVNLRLKLKVVTGFSVLLLLQGDAISGYHPKVGLGTSTSYS